MAKHQMRSFYRPHPRVTFDNDLVNPHTGEVSYPPSMTKQEFVAECDVNNVIKAYSQTGQITHVSAKAAQGAYVDLPDSVDFQQAIAEVRAAEQAFMSLPAKLRVRFGHDPAQFLAFMANPDNLPEMAELGLLKPFTEPAKAEKVEIAAKAGNPAVEKKSE